MCGQGEIWKEKNFLDYAQSDFEAVQQFAVRHRLDTAEYIACRKLTLIALEQQDYSKAKAYALRAHQISIKTPMSQEVTENQENERILSGSAYAIAYEKNIPDTMYRQLKRLSANTSLEIQTIALKLLSLYEIQGSGLQTHLLQYLRSQNEFSNQRFQKFTDASEREKKQLIAERDTIAAKQKNTLFISLTIFTLLLGSSLYAMADHRRKHELDRIRLILNQKEQTIHILEEKQESSEKLLSRLKEKEERMAELERRAQKLDEMQKLFGDRKEYMEKATQKMEELNTLKDQIHQKTLRDTKNARSVFDSAKISGRRPCRREASEADHAQMLKQNLQADQNQDDAACQLCLRLVAQAEEIADPKSGGGTEKRGDADQTDGQRHIDVRQQRKRDADSQRVDARGQRHQQHCFERKRGACFRFLPGEALLDHVRADSGQQHERDPVVKGCDVLLERRAKKIADGRHPRLKAAEPCDDDQIVLE